MLASPLTMRNKSISARTTPFWNSSATKVSLFSSRRSSFSGTFFNSSDSLKIARAAAASRSSIPGMSILVYCARTASILATARKYIIASRRAPWRCRLRRLDVSLHADRHQPLAVAPYPDARGAIGRAGIVRHHLRCDHRRRIAVNRESHVLYLTDRHRSSGLFLPFDCGDALRFAGWSAARVIEHEFIRHVLRPFLGIVGDAGLLNCQK